MRKPIIAGNWKLNNTLKETVDLVDGLKRELADIEVVDIVICPVYIYLSIVKDLVYDLNIKIGAQNVYWEERGAFTGEVSPRMLKDVGCEYVIIGHSERRQYFGETNETVNRKIKASLSSGLKPIVCVGESLNEREAGKTFDIIKDHITKALIGLTQEYISNIIIAYEPVWAIGTGRTASPEQAQEVHKYIRELLTKLFGEETASNTRIQYGGSVNPENIRELIAQEDVDGALVGGASLKIDSFSAIVKGAV